MEEKVLEIMRMTFGVDEVTTDASQKNCEQWDSLRHLTLASELEEAFDLELEPEEIAEMTDFARVVAMLKSKL
ncbi:MAG: acyl carrier protein [Muribaculaceae bacterium]|nr:acyl carrier protein [Muribaculaceae bacterium]MBR6948301.1 acyl carrier protein [Muribaculaceae bacterium]